MTALTDQRKLESAVRRAVAQTPISDIHTHLFPPSHGGLLLWGIDELLTYHYLVAELFTVAPGEISIEDFWKLPRSRRADLVWEYVFIRHGGLSEAARGVMTCLSALGLGRELAKRKLSAIREWFAAQSIDKYLPMVFELAGLDYAIMTNNPFVAAEVEQWHKGSPGHELLKTALRIDPLILDWSAAARFMRKAGYQSADRFDPQSADQARRYLLDWARRLDPLYLAASLPNDFKYPSDSVSTRVLDEVVIPTAGELGIPVALMIGVRKGVNPALGDGGDGVGVADVSAVQNLLTAYGGLKIICTMLSRDNQHELAVLARKFGRLHVEGCWWFCNNPSIIEETTRMRIELLGTAFTAQHSDARVLDQLIYKWAHTRAVLADVLVDMYRKQHQAGWRATGDEIRRDARALLGGSFEDFLKK